MMPIIAGSCGGVVGLAAVILYVRKKRMDQKKQSNAANFVESQPTNTKKSYGKDAMMSGLSLGPDATPDNLGSMFMSKKPNATSAIDTMMSMKPNQAVFSDATTQESSSSNKSQSPAKQVSRFNDYSDISDVTFSQLEPIGSGAFGLVYRVELSMGVVAVKVPKSNFKQASKEYNDMLSEAEFLSKLRHTNITLLLGYGNHPSGSIIFLMEFADSSLADVLKSGPLQPDLLLEYAHGIVRGLLYLHTHSPPISHRDLKPENVLLVGGVAKLADFGLATARDFVSKTTGFAGTPIWSPPEAFDKFPGPPGDIYAFGLLLWSMMSGKTPYEGKSFNEVLSAKSKNQVPDIPSTCPSNISKVMKQCWKMNPNQRPRAYDLEKVFSEIRNL
eukprot:TRINITY_DN2153_c0_g1_i5.p1 TRINITY_DN2153_c0_g1~~TRINITY_DN2153_c0_g1_i5.p1  ORF type:complete len:387 (+),score=97.53 TRINITY_DN2153_c0_g1_i5:1202-2362(+)